LPDQFAIADRITKAYVTPTGTVEALHEVDAEFPQGQVSALVGVSGSGKSTLLRLLAALDTPTSGQAIVHGRDLGELDGQALREYRRDNVGYVSQRAADNFVPHLTILEHAGRNADVGIFQTFGIAHKLHDRPSQLSGGELARAAFALALTRRVPIVLADEPTAELDRASAGALLEAIHSSATGGTTFVIATHDEDVLEIAHHVVRLDRGRNAAETVPAEPVARGRARGDVAVAVRGVTKSYAGVAALRDVSLDLHAAELAVLVGRSGSGKSTLLMLLGGWEAPDAGSIAPSPRRSWSELAYVPQRPALVPELSVRENIELPARLAGRLEERRPQIAHLLGELGLAELADRYPHETSVGQQQRASLARALVLEPQVVLVDEPTSHQDPIFRDRVWSLLLAATERGTSCLVATHEARAHAYAHVTWEIDGGRLSGPGGTTLVL
jgi:putative ABC transport system ATP-binding protein